MKEPNLTVIQILKIYHLFLFVLLFQVSNSQESSKAERLLNFPDKVFTAADKKAKSLEDKLQKNLDKYLSRLERQEQKLKRKLWKKDSAIAKQVFGDIDARYGELRNTNGAVNKYSSVYSARLDSMSTVLKFMEQNQLTHGPEAQKLLTQYQNLQSQLNISEQVRKQVVQRQQMLKEQLGKLGMVKELKHSASRSIITRHR